MSQSAQTGPGTDAPGAPAMRMAMLVVAIGLIALNLRPALTSPGPLLSEIMSEFGIDTALAGGITGISLACLGVFGAVAPRLARAFGPERVILALIAVLAAGCALRGTGSVVSLFVGMVLAGLGIGVVQVLLPGIIKRDFVRNAGAITGLYTMNLCLGAAIGTGLAIPLERTLGSWQLSLAAWAVPAIIAAALWMPQAFARQSPAPRIAHPGRLRRDPLAWAVTGFMGLQSCLAYIVIGLMPLILEERGVASEQAGFITAIAILPQALTALVVPHVAARMRRQSGVAVVSIVVSAIGFFGLVFGPPSLALVFAVIEGLGLGAAIGIAILFMVIRSPDSQVATDLSGMSQSVGYLAAAFGILTAGVLRDVGADWTLPAVFFLFVAVLNAVSGWYAGCDALVMAPREPG